MARSGSKRSSLAIRSAFVIMGLVACVMAAGPAAASGGGGCGGPITDGRGSTVEIRRFCFTPTVLRTAAGTRVTFTNLDPMQHNVLGANGAWGSFEPLRFDRSTSYRFARAGVYPYVCTLHPGMVGTVLVGSEATGMDGSSTAVVPINAGPARFVAGGPAEPASDGWKAVAVAIPLVVVLTGLVLAGRRRGD
jgi:plastocyanin